MADEKLFHVGIKALIENKQGQVLLFEQDITNHSIPTQPYWDLPGGRIEHGEDILNTLQREVAEETGIEQILESEFLTAVISNHEIGLDNGERAGLVLMVYRVKVAEDARIVISDEHTAYEWVDRTEAAERLRLKYPKQFTDVLSDGRE